MIPGLLLLAIAAVGAAYGGLVIRAAPTRRDNVVFGALALSDAAMITWPAINVPTGERIVSEAATLPCTLGTMVMAVLTLDFLYAFPGQPAMRWRWRGLLIAWAAAAACAIAFGPDGNGRFIVAELVYFGPMTALVMMLAARARRRTEERAARVIIAMLCFRWGFGFIAYLLGPFFGRFEEALWAETTFATLLSFVIIGTAVLRQNLFSIRSAAAEATLASTMALIVVLAGGGSIFGVLQWTEPGSLQTALLVGATLVPLAVAAVCRALYPRIETSVLAGIDDRRARRLALEDGPLPAESDRAIVEACRRIAEIGDGARVEWEVASQLDPAIVLDGATNLVRHGSSLVVPARGVDRTLVGAFVIEGGTIDRDTFVVARDLAVHVALAVERAQAVSELEDARRLAALGQFAAAIAHDLRTPLPSISMNVSRPSSAPQPTGR